MSLHRHVFDDDAQCLFTMHKVCRVDTAERRPWRKHVAFAMSLSPTACAATHAQRPLFDFLGTTLPCSPVAAAADGMVWRRGYYQERGVTARAASSSSAPPRYMGSVNFSKSLSLEYYRSLLTCDSSSSSTPRSPPAGNKAAAAAAAKVAEVAEDCGCGPEGGQSLVYVCICMYAGMCIHIYTHTQAHTHTYTLTNNHT